MKSTRSFRTAPYKGSLRFPASAEGKGRKLKDMDALCAGRVTGWIGCVRGGEDVCLSGRKDMCVVGREGWIRETEQGSCLFDSLFFLGEQKAY